MKQSPALRLVKAKIKKLERENTLLWHYAECYGNASGTCAFGYPQHPGYVCGYCGADRSVSRKCPKAE